MAQYRVNVRITSYKHGGYVAEVPALQGCRVFSESVPQALFDIHECIEMYIESLLKHGEPIPDGVIVVKGQGAAPLELELPVNFG